MYSVLKKFLALHHHLALPGIGIFTVDEKPAYIDIANRTVHPPLKTIKFDNEKQPANKLFFHFLAQELNLDELQATSRFTDFTARLNAELSENKTVTFDKLGTLKKQSSNIISFEPEKLPEYFPILTAERVIRKHATHTVKVGEDERTSDEMHIALQEEEVVAAEDRWWIPAIILGLIGIAALIYYYNVLHQSHF